MLPPNQEVPAWEGETPPYSYAEMLTLRSAPPCRHLEPGGWIELQDLELVAYSDDGTLEPGAPIIRMFDVIRLVKGIKNNWGVDNHTLAVRQHLEAAGFQKVEMRMHRKVPWSSWPRTASSRKVRRGSRRGHFEERKDPIAVEYVVYCTPNS